MTTRGLWCAGSVLSAILLFGVVAEAQQVPAAVSQAGRFVFGAGLGLQPSMADNTPFGISLGGDYFSANNFSLGPLLQIGVAGDLFQLGLTARAKYTFDLPPVPELKPHVEGGIGFLYANLDRPGHGSRDDTSFLIPLGVGVEYRLSPRLSLDTTAFFNFTDINVKNTDRNFFFTWLLGLRVPF